jgi:WD40 repeat protein
MMLMCTPNQVAKDDQLLNIATDYLQFVTRFFEVIDVSATHIYHSALEKSPLSSIVRKLYYSRRPYPLPIVVGIPDSWDPTIASFSTGATYLSSTWSPCGQFVAAVNKKTLEIWDASTLTLLSTIQSIGVATKFRVGLAYSPDGRSLASCSNIGIVIWDTQTGGVVKIIACEVTRNGLGLVWSLDGMTIGTISPRVSGTLTINTYEIASGAIKSSGTLRSRDCQYLGATDSRYLWAHDKSFRVVVETGGWPPISVFEVGSTLIQVEQFHIRPYMTFNAFSPTTYRVSIQCHAYDNNNIVLFILDVRTSEVLLRETGPYYRHTFSPDGTFFAVSVGDHLRIWRYTSGRYTRWKNFLDPKDGLQFSPNSLSILGCSAHFLHISHLDSPASLPVGSDIKIYPRLQDAFSPDRTYIVTAHRGGSTITITDLDSQHLSPSQFIDTDLEISMIVLTDNVLLVKGPVTVVAWLLTERGVVDGVFGNTRADRNDSLWTIIPPPVTLPAQPKRSWGNGDSPGGVLGFSVEDEIAVIKHNGRAIRAYHTRTGEILELDKAPRSFKVNYDLNHYFYGHCEPYHRDSLKHRGPLKCDWLVSETTLQGGWVKDPEGKHRLWLHADWRNPMSIHWLHNATLRLTIPSELILIRF